MYSSISKNKKLHYDKTTLNYARPPKALASEAIGLGNAQAGNTNR